MSTLQYVILFFFLTCVVHIIIVVIRIHHMKAIIPDEGKNKKRTNYVEPSVLTIDLNRTNRKESPEEYRQRQSEMFRKERKVGIPCPRCKQPSTIYFEHCWESDGKYQCPDCCSHKLMKGYSPGYFDDPADRKKIICPRCKTGRVEPFRGCVGDMKVKKETGFTHWCNDCSEKQHKKGTKSPLRTYLASFIVHNDGSTETKKLESASR